jgi:cadmium resistance protein CadD (predicted permease)
MMFGGGGAGHLAAVAAISFFATNTDSLAGLSPLLRATTTAHRRRIFAGCLTGTLVILLIAAMLAPAVAAIPGHWTRWAGIVPFAIGLRKLLAHTHRIRARRNPKFGQAGFATCFALTVSLGADNIAIVAPLMRTLGGYAGTLLATAHLLLFAAAIVLLVSAWRARLINRPSVTRAAACLTIAVGAFILVE